MAAPQARTVVGDRGSWWSIAEGLAAPVVFLRYHRLQSRQPHALQWLDRTHPGRWQTLQKIFLSRLLRQPVATFFRPRIIVDGNISAVKRGCVLALFRSPLSTLASNELVARNISLVSGQKWGSRMGHLHVSLQRSELRRLVRDLRRGTSAAAVMDKFTRRGGVPSRFLDVPVRVLSGPVQLAAAGRVPVVPTTIQWQGGLLRIHLHAEITVRRGRIGRQRATDAVLQVFERQVREDPGGWSRLIPFLRRYALQGVER
jgi:hypothetical protein